jgi:hypothetical protein
MRRFSFVRCLPAGGKSHVYAESSDSLLPNKTPTGEYGVGSYRWEALIKTTWVSAKNGYGLGIWERYERTVHICAGMNV